MGDKKQRGVKWDHSWGWHRRKTKAEMGEVTAATERHGQRDAVVQVKPANEDRQRSNRAPAIDIFDGQSSGPEQTQSASEPGNQTAA
jgi:hypothetical protein